MTARSSTGHVAVVCAGCGGSGSVANVARHQAAGLSRKFRVSLISDSHTDETGGASKVRIRPSNYHWLRRLGHVPREIAFARSARRALFEMHAAEPIDLVLCHSHVVASIAASPLQAHRHVPFGLVTHGDIFDRPSGTYDPMLTWLYKATTQKAYRGSALIVALSPHMAELAVRHGASPHAVTVVPNGVDIAELDLDDSRPTPSRLDLSSPLSILFVGRMAIEKGVDVLLSACVLLHNRGIPFDLTLAGDGPRRADLEAFASVHLPAKVRFLGSVDRARLGRLYRSCHVVCVPSRSDPLPTVAIEALAAGRAVVGASVGGIPFIVEHEKSGLVVPSESPTALAAALERLARNDGLLDTLSLNGFEAFRTRFEWRNATDRLSEEIAARIR